MASQPPRNLKRNFSVISQNTQGGCNVGFMTGHIRRNDVVLLQESGAPGFMSSLSPHPTLVNVYTGTHNFGSIRRKYERFIVHHMNNRCSQSVILNTDLGPVTPFLIPAPSPDLRPIVGASTGLLAIASFHAPSGNANAASGVLRSQISLALAAYPNFLLGGDANSDINEQAVTGTVKTYAPEGATHQGGGHLDGMVSSLSVSGMPLVNVGMNGGDHSAIKGEFNI